MFCLSISHEAKSWRQIWSSLTVVPKGPCNTPTWDWEAGFHTARRLWKFARSPLAPGGKLSPGRAVPGSLLWSLWNWAGKGACLGTHSVLAGVDGVRSQLFSVELGWSREALSKVFCLLRSTLFWSFKQWVLTFARAIFTCWRFWVVSFFSSQFGIY